MITRLTKEQEDKMPEYIEEGIAIGRATCSAGEFEARLPKIRELTDLCRTNCGFKKAKIFRHYLSPIAALKNNAGTTVHNALYGLHDIEWLQTGMFYRRELGMTAETEVILPLYELAKLSGWMWFNDTTTVVSAPPSELHFSTTRRDALHNSKGMAVKYADGTGLYCLNGMVVPVDLEWIVTTPINKLTSKKILAIENVEFRTAAMSRYGLDKFKNKIGTVIDTWESKTGGTYRLYSVKLDTGFTRVYLEGACPSSGKSFFECVSPEITKCQQALVWREPWTKGIPAANSVYIEPLQRT